MDYETKATNRRELRLYAKLFRSICGYNGYEPINPIELLDKLPDLEGFQDVRYEIVYGDTLPGNVPAQCIQTEDGYLIQIKESVYLGAYREPVKPQIEWIARIFFVIVICSGHFNLNRICLVAIMVITI